MVSRTRVLQNLKQAQKLLLASALLFTARHPAAVATGASTERDNVSALAAHIYRAILIVLPASVHTWFSDIRDRGKSQAVEAYTTLQESPALLKHELSVLQVRQHLSLN